MTTTSELARFVQSVEYDDLPEETVDALKMRLLDSIGIAAGALDAAPTEAVFATVAEANPGGDCTLWGRDETASPVGAAMHNTALVRYLDYMDSFLAPGETPHPSDNVGAVVAAAEYADASGRELLEGLAVAYEVQGELAWNAPVRERGFDHVTHTVISAACGVAAVLGLDDETTRDAIGIAGTAHNALRVTRTGGINEWKGIASANAVRNAVYAGLLAKNGVDGPRDLFEGQKGWKQVISGPFEVDLDVACSRVHDTMTKRFVAETYAQSAVEAIVELAETHEIAPEDVDSIDLETFAGAKLIIGGGEGDRYEVREKAQADHSLPYMLAVALIDRQLGTAQYEQSRIELPDVQRLLRTVDVTEDSGLTERFEAGEMPACLEVSMDDGTVYERTTAYFLGHPARPMDWERLEGKFHGIAADSWDAQRRDQVLEAIDDVENRDVASFVERLA